MPKAREGENDQVGDLHELAAGKLFTVAGKVALVTGGGSGIGAMIAAGFVANGATVYCVSRKDTSKYCSSLNDQGPGKAISLQADLSKPENVVSLVAELAKRETALHILVNNSGTNWAESIDTYSPDAFDSVMQLNVRAVFDLSSKCIPLLTVGSTEGDPSRVINISSVDSITFPALETYAYSAGKAAVSHMSRVMAGKLARRGGAGITVNAILPGAFYSRMMRATIENAGSLLEASIPLARIGGVGDISGACLFLASKAGAWVTGTTFAVDGGGSVSSTHAPPPSKSRL